MSRSSTDCAPTREALPELALGIADGEQRALALVHIAHCPECRRALEELASLADELVALTPQREPPPGFENRVLDRLDSPERDPAGPGAACNAWRLPPPCPPSPPLRPWR